MHVHFFVSLLISSWVCFGFAREKKIINKEENPNDPKYQNMANELIQSHLRIKNKDIKKVTIIKVSRQEHKKNMTTIQLRLFLVNGKSSLCNFRIWHKKSMEIKFVSNSCDSVLGQKTLSSSPYSLKTRDPKDRKYLKAAVISLDAFFKIHGEKLFKKSDVLEIYVHRVKVQKNHILEIVMRFGITTLNNKHFICTSALEENSWNRSHSGIVTDVTCKPVNGDNEQGSPVPQNPDDHKYRQLAIESFKTYQKRNGVAEFKQIKVTKVTKQVVSDVIIRIDFTVYPHKGESFPCQSHIVEKAGNYNEKVTAITCNMKKNSDQIPGGQDIQNPYDLKYSLLAQESFQIYQKANGFISVRFIKVTKVTTQVVSGLITRIDFIVYPHKGTYFSCQSKITVQNQVHKKIIDVDCDRKNIPSQPSDQKPENSNEPKYKQLATESFNYYQQNNGFTIDVKQLIVTKVTTQVGNGIITRIDFTVYPYKGKLFSCHSQIQEKKKTHVFNVKCEENNPPSPGDKELQNPNEPQYLQLATESLEYYQQTKGFIDVKEIIVNKVTTQVVYGTIARIDFTVICTDSSMLYCHSVITKKGSARPKHIEVTCDEQKNKPVPDRDPSDEIPGAPEPKNPKDPKYKQLATQSLEYYQQTKGFINVKEIIVNRVTTQVVSGTIAQIDFTVICTDSPMLYCHSEITIKGSAQPKHIEVTCEEQKHKPVPDRDPSDEIPGAPEPKNPKDPKYKQLATESLEYYQQTKGFIDVKEIIVNNVTKQVVSGTITRIDFTVIRTDSSKLYCHSVITKKGPARPKHIKVTCDEQKHKPVPDRDPVDEIPRAPEPKNPKDPKYKQLATESLEYYQKTKGFMDVKEIIVNKVTTEVVSGTITRIDFTVICTDSPLLYCHSEIAIKGSAQPKHIEVTCDEQKHKPVPDIDPIDEIPGAPKPKNPKDPKYKQLATESLEYYQKTKGFIDVKEIIVNKVTTEVVSGTITRIDFTVICTDSPLLYCHSEIAIKGSAQPKHIEVTCDEQKHKPVPDRDPSDEIPGAPKPKNPKDPKYKQLATESLEYYQKTKGFINIKEITVNYVTRQVVSGTITRIDFTVICTDSPMLYCHSEITIKGSARPKHIEVTCEEQKHKPVPDRDPSDEIPGAPEPKNPKDPKYKQLATESIEYYQQTKGFINVKEIIVNRVTTQVVSGTIARIDFTVICTDSPLLYCHSEITIKAPARPKHIEVTCEEQKHKPVPDRDPSDEIPGAPEPKNPKDPKYKQLATESLEYYQKTKGFIDVKEIIVNNVTRQVVSGITRIDFTVIRIDSPMLYCHSIITIKGSAQPKHIEVTCDEQKHKPDPDRDPNDEIPETSEPNNPNDQKYPQRPQNHSDPQYKQLAKEAFDHFQMKYGFVTIKELIVTKVTTQVDVGVIKRIDFNVISTEGQSMSCHSKILENEVTGHKNISVTCKKQDSSIPIRQIPKNPRDPKYKQLATEAFDEFQIKYGTVTIKELIVTKVTTQVVDGIITRIDFNVVSTEGQSLSCHSEISDLVYNKVVKTKCETQNNPSTPGAQIPQNPSDAKYKRIAKEAFDKYQETYGTIQIKEFIVTKVTTQVVAGIITRIDFNVISVEGQSFPCHSETVENEPNRNKNIKVTCEKQENSSIPGKQVPKNPSDPKYNQLAREAFDQFQIKYGTVTIKELMVTKVTEQVVAGIITRIDFDVIPTEGQSLSCHSEISDLVYNKVVKTKCETQNNTSTPGAQIPQNPSDAKYKQIAKEAFDQYQETYGTIQIKEFIVTKVTTQVVAGLITRIDFNVISTEGRSLPCHSETIENELNRSKNIKVTCEKQKNSAIPGEQVPKNPSDPKYKQLATEAFDQFQMKYGTVTIKELMVTKVTEQVVAGIITRIDFDVIPTEGQSLSCHSEISDLVYNKVVKTKCETQNNTSTPGAQIPQNPSDAKYKQIAKEAFDQYQETYGTIQIKEFIVTKVTTQVVAGLITRIDFNVISTEGRSLPCHSETIENELNRSKNIKVTCEKQKNSAIPGEQVPKNPSDPKYKQLATEAFDQFQMKYGTVTIKELIVTKVTEQVVAGIITRIDFDVIPTEGQSLSCHSEISDMVYNKVVKTRCETQNNPSIPGGVIAQNPDDTKYKQIAKEAFDKYQETYGTITVKEFIVTKVTTQVVAGLITRIDFNVISVEGQSLPCHCETVENESNQSKNIKVTCEKSENSSVPDEQIPQIPGHSNGQILSPDDPKYLELAKESFSRYLDYKMIRNIQARIFRVYKVMKEMLSEKTVLSINFYVFPTKGRVIPCESSVTEIEYDKYDYSVNCEVNNKEVGKEEKQNPDEPQYYELAKESFRNFQKEYSGALFHVEMYKVTKVTTQIQMVQGLLTTIEFNVILNSGQSFPCRSLIMEESWPGYKEVVVKCEYGNKSRLKK